MPLARRCLAWLLVAFASLHSGCATNQFTVDDGRQVDEGLLASIRTFGEGERMLRPAIARSAALADPDCDKQWELPFSVASSESWSRDERVAWVRALGVDERLTVVAAAPDSPLRIGERIVGVQGSRHQAEPADSLLFFLGLRRDAGQAFDVYTGPDRQVRVTPFEVCRGYARLSPPNTPRLQDYHWAMSYHPLELPAAALTDDEALWVVLWTQGLSEEGGLRMKAYHYGTGLVSTLFTLATLASGLKAAAVAAEAAGKTIQAAAAQFAADTLRQQAIGQAGSYATRLVREEIGEATDRRNRETLKSALERAAANRESLSGVAGIGASVFDRADRWAFERAAKLRGDALAGFRLHQKLIEQGWTANAFALDVERLKALHEVAKSRGQDQEVVAILGGVRPESLRIELATMPLASVRRDFRFEGPREALTIEPYAGGVVDTMLHMPIESKAPKQ